jgi:ribonuclease G
MDYLSSALPELQQKVKFYDSPISVFEASGIEKELRKAMQEKVWLKSGGYLVIQETEALVSVDVNTGKYVGEDDAMNTILNTNLEAVEEIVRQMRLRDLGGIIVIDFIDMDWRQHRQMVYRKFQKEIQKDRARTNILHISELGLVEMTRQRMRPSLASLMTDKCPYCEGRGTILATDTILVNLLRSVKSAHQRTRRRKLKVIANDQIINKLRNDSRVKRLERNLDIRLRLQNNVDLHLEDFHIYDDRDKEISLNW